jgi:hypothetical protein
VIAVVGALGIQISDEKVPLRAPVLVHDATRTYFAPICVKPGRGDLRPTTLSAAHDLKYKLDDDCRNSGAFSTEGTSAAKFLLIKIGLLSYPRRWWDGYQ